MTSTLELYRRIGNRETLAQRWNDLPDEERASTTFNEWKLKQGKDYGI